MQAIETVRQSSITTTIVVHHHHHATTTAVRCHYPRAPGTGTVEGWNSATAPTLFSQVESVSERQARCQHGSRRLSRLDFCGTVLESGGAPRLSGRALMVRTFVLCTARETLI